VSYEALIAAQAKRLTKKRERKMDWPSADQITERFDRMAWWDDCRAEGVTWGVKEVTPTHFDGSRTYADLYVPPAPERVELSHMEWADGYKQWRDAHKTPSYIGVFGLDPEWHERAEQGKAYRRLRCFAENEI
jgi:hypothetical protein